MRSERLGCTNHDTIRQSPWLRVRVWVGPKHPTTTVAEIVGADRIASHPPRPARTGRGDLGLPRALERRGEARKDAHGAV